METEVAFYTKGLAATTLTMLAIIAAMIMLSAVFSLFGVGNALLFGGLSVLAVRFGFGRKARAK